MKLKRSKSFFEFIFDRYTPKKQIRFLLCNPTHLQLQSIIEVVYNLEQNNFIKIPSLVRRKIKDNKRIVSGFTSSKKQLEKAEKILNKHFRFIFFLLYKSKQLILRAIDQ